MSNPFCYVEFHTREPDRFNAFYGQLFHWNIEEIVPGNWSVDTGTFPVGGMRQAAPDMPTEILIYTQVDDIHRTIARAQALGARQIQPKTELPRNGWVAVIEDPDGNKIGLFEPLLEAAPGAAASAGPPLRREGPGEEEEGHQEEARQEEGPR